MLPFLLLPSTAIADVLPAGTTVDNAATIDIAPDGLNALLEVLPTLLPEQIDVDNISEEGGSGFLGCVTEYAFAVSDLWINVGVADAQLNPQDGYLDLNITLLVKINDPSDTFSLTTDAVCISSTCDGYVDEFEASVQGQIYMLVDDFDGDGTNEIDATIENINVAYALNEEYIHLDDCALDTIEDVLNFFGISVYGLILDLAGPELENAISDLIPELELTIEEAFSELNISEEFELLDSTIQLNLQPNDFLIQPEGLRLAMNGSAAASEAAECVTDFDPGGSLLTTSGMAEIGNTPSGYHLSANLSDDFINQALYAIWQSGALCYTIDEDVFALDTTILNLLSGDAFADLFPEAQPIFIQTLPRQTLSLNMRTNADLAVDVEELGLQFYANVDERQARVLELDLQTDVGLNILYDNQVGSLKLDVDIDPTRVQTTVLTNEFQPTANSDIEASFSDQLDTILALINIEDQLSDLSFSLPSYNGIGLSEMQVAASGDDDEDLSLHTKLGEVSYTGGCNSEEEGTDGCSSDGGCSSNGRSQGRWFLSLFALSLGLCRRRSANKTP